MYLIAGIILATICINMKEFNSKNKNLVDFDKLYIKIAKISLIITN